MVASTAMAVDYTWTSPTTSGSWSVAGNWTPAGSPTTADTAVLDTVTASNVRTVTYDSASSGVMTGLTMNQTASGTNLLQAARGFRVSSTAGPVTLGAAGDGLARIFLDPQSGTVGVTGTFSGGITLNAGGMLSIGAFNPAASATNSVGGVNGSVLVSGGSMVLEPYVRNGTNAGSQGNSITGALSMTSGTITINNASAGSGGSLHDRRLTVSGSLGITGGSVVAGSSLTGGLYLNGSPNTYQPSSVTNNVNVQLGASADQTLTTNQAIPTLTSRASGVKTYTSTLTGTNFGALILADENTGTASSRTTFKMASDLTLQSGRNLPSTSGLSVVEPTTLRIDVGIDAAAYTLNLAANSGVWTPNTPVAVGSGTTTYWWLTGTSGTMVANGFKFDTAGVATSVGPGLVLESRSGNSVANVLSLGSGTGAIDSTSTFRYAGAAAAGTPSTLASSRAIGSLEVNSGALQLTSLAGVQAVRVASGASLDLGGLSLTVSSGSFGGSVSNGTLTSSGGWSVTTGTVAAALAGTSALTKSGAGLVSLAGANTFNGGVTITGGTLQAGTAGAFGPSGTITMSGGGIGYGSGVTTDFSSRFSTAADQTLAVNVGGNAVTLASSLVSGGTGSFTRSGAGLLTLTGPASSIGTQGVVVNGGTTVIDPGAGGSFTNAGRLFVGNQSGASVLQFASGTASIAPGAGTYINLADNASATATIDIMGASATFSLANVRLMVGNKGTGTLRVSSGTLSVTGGNPIYVGGDQQFGTNTANGTMTVSAGVMQVTGSGLFVLGHSGTSGLNTSAAGTLNLDGGELRTARSITRSGGVGTVNFNGGTLTALASSGTFLQGMTAANVLGGAAINTNGFDVTIGQALLGTGSGGLAKSGAGTLRLTGASTYTGATTVSAGRMLVDGSLLGATSVSVLTGATLGGSGTAVGAVAVLGGTLSPGNSPGVLTVGSLSFDSAATTLMEIAGTTAGTQYDQVVLSGSVAYDGGLVLDLSQTFPDNTTFSLFKDFTSFSGNLASLASVGTAYNGVTFTRSGDVWTSTQSGGQSLQFSQTTGNLIVVPEPASLAAAGLAAVGVLAAIRRRLSAGGVDRGAPDQ